MRALRQSYAFSSADAVDQASPTGLGELQLFLRPLGLSFNIYDVFDLSNSGNYAAYSERYILPFGEAEPSAVRVRPSTRVSRHA